MADKITAKDAIKIAQEYFQYATGNFGLRLNVEEIEKSSSSSHWMVTMSYEDTPAFTGGFDMPIVKTKIFEIDAITGEVHSMKNPSY